MVIGIAEVCRDEKRRAGKTGMHLLFLPSEYGMDQGITDSISGP
jgi:hypothetical protein